MNRLDSTLPPIFNISALKNTSLDGPRSILRLVKVFAYLAAHSEGQTLTQLSIALSLPKTTLFMMLKVLEGADYLSSVGGNYRLGPEAVALGVLMAESPRRNFPECARPTLQALSVSTGETCFLAVLTADRRFCRYIATVETENWLRFSVKLGSTKPVYATGSGRAMLAFMPTFEVKEILQAISFDKVTSRTVSSRRALLGSLKEVRQRGASVVDSGTVEGVIAVAAPIFGADGAVAAAVTVGGPTARIEQRLGFIEKAVRSAAEDISLRLGFRGSWPAGVHPGR